MTTLSASSYSLPPSTTPSLSTPTSNPDVALCAPLAIIASDTLASDTPASRRAPRIMTPSTPSGARLESPTLGRRRGAPWPTVGLLPKVPRLQDAVSPTSDTMLRRHIKDGSTALHIAVRGNRHDEVLRLLRQDGGAAVHARDAAGRTPLHIAAAQGSSLLVGDLLAAGADCLALDNQGQTPMFAAADGDTLGLAHTFMVALRNKPAKEPALANAAAIRRRLTDFEHTHPDLTDNDIDTLCAALVGESVATLNDDEDLLKYRAHLKDLNGNFFAGIRAEGWYARTVLLQRIRAMVFMALRPASLPTALAHVVSPADASAILDREIAGALATLQVVRRVAIIGAQTNKPVAKLLTEIEAANVLDRIDALSDGDEYCFPLGKIGHQIYAGLHATQVGTTPVITFRLDNLGGGIAGNQRRDPDTGKVSPVAFNMPRAYLQTAAGRDAFTNAIAILIANKTDAAGGMDYIYDALDDLRQAMVENGVDDDFVYAPTDEGDEYEQAPQSVGNCTLKNHNAGIQARMAHFLRAKLGPTASREAVVDDAELLWRWWKKQEVQIATDTFFRVVTPQRFAKADHDKEVRDLASLLSNPTQRLLSVTRFFAEAEGTDLARDLTAAQIQGLVRDSDLATLKLLLDHGLDLKAHGELDNETLLHVAVLANARAEVIEVLLTHGVSPRVVNSDDLTPEALAVKHRSPDDLIDVLHAANHPRSAPSPVAQAHSKYEHAMQQLLAARAELDRLGPPTAWPTADPVTPAMSPPRADARIRAAA